MNFPEHKVWSKMMTWAMTKVVFTSVYYSIAKKKKGSAKDKHEIRE